MATITVHDGVAWFEDATSVKASVSLIKAAPDLLAALEEILDLFEWDKSGGVHEAAYDSARAAIAKAKRGE